MVTPIGRMTPYGMEHWAALAVTVCAGIALVIIVRRTVQRHGRARADRGFVIAGWALLAVVIAWMVWDLLPMNWNIGQSLPFQLSDAARVVTAAALITRRWWLIAITYYWGLTLNLQSIVTPDLNYFHAPALEYVAYWVFHIAVLLAPIVFVWGAGERPSWRGYTVSLGATAAWAAVAGTVNAITGANYGYLAHAPVGPSALDFLGPWPQYLLWEGVLIVAVWALITLPWVARRRVAVAAGY